MGLESVEILMEVENAFGIKISDPEAEKIITVSDFHNCVWKHLQGKQVDKCRSQALFYQLRSELAKQGNTEQRLITPESHPNELWPIAGRRQTYKQYESSSGLILPALELPGPLSDVLTWFSIGSIIGSLVTAFILTNFYDYSGWLWLGPVIILLLLLGVSELLQPFRTRIPHPTMRAFTMHTLKDNYKKLTDNEGTNRREMEAVINHIIADKIGLDIKEVTPEKRIADDLGVD